MSLTGDELRAPALDLGGEVWRPLVQACEQTGSVALVGAPVADAAGAEFTATVAVSGEGVPVDGWRIGLGTCRDTGVAEHVEATAARGVDVFAAGLADVPEDGAVQRQRAERDSTVDPVPTSSYARRVLELVTGRLLLRGFAPDDVEAVHAYAGDPEVCRYTDWGPNTPAQSQAFVDEVHAASTPERSGSMTWAVTTAGNVVGACSVTVTSHEHRRGVMGYVLARAHWGQGYATEAATAVLRFARQELGLSRVEATCRPGNVASQRVLRKIGMRQEGLLRSHLVIRGRREDSLLFAAVD